MAKTPCTSRAKPTRLRCTLLEPYDPPRPAGGRVRGRVASIVVPSCLQAQICRVVTSRVWMHCSHKRLERERECLPARERGAAARSVLPTTGPRKNRRTNGCRPHALVPEGALALWCTYVRCKNWRAKGCPPHDLGTSSYLKSALAGSSQERHRWTAHLGASGGSKSFSALLRRANE